MKLVDFVGLPYEKGGRGPDGFDCWGLVRYYYLHVQGITLPDFPGIAEDARETIRRIEMEKTDGNCWIPTDVPRFGELALMTTHRRTPHVGIYIEETIPRILHAAEGRTSCMETLRQVANHGIKKVEYFKWSPQFT